jgi:hypothetical protein
MSKNNSEEKRPSKPILHQKPPMTIDLKPEDKAKLSTLYNDAMVHQQRLIQSQRVIAEATAQYNRANGALEVFNDLIMKEMKRIDDEYKLPKDKTFTFDIKQNELVEVISNAS